MMETTKRIAKKVYFAELAEFCEQNPTVIFSDDIDAGMMQAFAEHELELLAKKKSSTGERKLTPEQKRNEVIKAEILDFLRSDGGLHTIAEMIKNVPSLMAMENVSPQRVSALLTQLGTKHGTGEVRSEIIKRVTYFQINS